MNGNGRLDYVRLLNRLFDDMIVWRVVNFIVHRVNWCEWLVIGKWYISKDASHVGSE